MKNNIRKISNFVLIGIFVLLAILLGVSWTKVNKNSATGKTLVDFDCNILNGEGQWISLAEMDKSMANGLKEVKLRGNFAEEITAGKQLWFFAENAQIVLLVNGEKVFECNQKANAPSIYKSAGSDWYAYTSEGISKDDVVELEIRAYYGQGYDNATALLGNMFVGEKGHLFQDLFSKFNFIALVLIIALLAGFIYIIEGIIYKFFKMKEATQIVLFGLYLLTGALWGLTDIFHTYLSLIFTPPWVASLVDIAGVLLFPIALMLVVRHFMRGKTTSIIMNYVVLMSVVVVFISIIMQLVGLADLKQQQGWLGIMAIAMLAITTCCVIKDLKVFKDRYLILLLLAISPVFLSISIDSVNILFRIMERRLLMQYAFAFSAVIMVSQLVLFAQQESKKAQQMQQMKEQILSSRIATLLSQIKPHFLFNTLTSINYLCETDPKTASYAVTEFSKFLRGNIDALSQIDLIPFERELEHLRHYLAIEKLRYADRLKIEMDIKDTGFFLPSLSLQPIVENAIKHGLGKKEDGGILKISSYENDNEHIIEVCDNGVGFDVKKKDDDKTQLGIENVHTRLLLQSGATLTIESEPNKGTNAKIVIPKKAKEGELV